MNILPDMIILVLVFFLGIFPKIKDRTLKESLPVILFCVYMTCVFHITLMPFISGIKLAFADDGCNFNLNLIPYIDVIRQRGNYSRQVFLNILLFIPFGFLYPLIRKTTLLKTVLFGFCLSLSIEILQFFFSVRIADVTDLINNTAGAFLGAALYFILNRTVRLFRDRAVRG